MVLVNRLIFIKILKLNMDERNSHIKATETTAWNRDHIDVIPNYIKFSLPDIFL